MQQYLRSTGLAALVSATLLVSACDSEGPNAGADVNIEGRVTTAAANGRPGGEEVDDATVTGENVDDEGDRSPAEGGATTDDDGRYSLDLENATEVVIVTARKGTFQSSALVYTAGESNVEVVPITAESNAEVQVYVEAKEDDGAGDVTVADVVASVTGTVSDEVNAGRASATQVAAAIRASAQAEAEYVQRKESAERRRRVRDEKLEAFARFQVALSAAGSVDAQREAMEEYESDLVQAYEDAGASAETQAQARLVALAALRENTGSMSGEASLALRQHAHILAARATGEAVRAAFQAEGASNSRLQTLQQLEVGLLAELRASSSASAMEDAWDEYRSDVEAQLAAEMNVSATAISAARQSFAAARAALLAGLATVDDGREFAELYATFFTTANASVTQSFAGNSRADLAATVLTVLSAS